MAILALLSALIGIGFCQYFPPTPEGVTTLESRFHNGVKISYKENDICETTPGVHSYTGYVHIPAGATEDMSPVKQNFPINLFFWFYEARKNPKNAPLAIWLNGGPGCSSLIGMLDELGPCWVNPDANSTRINEWSWNNEVNMLFIDQPSHAGFSYDNLINTTNNLQRYDDITQLWPGDVIPQQNWTFLVGTDSTHDFRRVTAGTHVSSFAFWHFAQAWFQEFPFYAPRDGKISLAAESYGGKYGPAFSALFQEQNEKIKNNTWKVAGEQHILHLDTVIIVNGFVDSALNFPSYPDFTQNNTYGFKTVNETTYKNMTRSIPTCLEKLNVCQNASKKFDPDQLGLNDTVNNLCIDAADFCNTYIQGAGTDPTALTRDFYDISLQRPQQARVPFFKQFLQQPHVQSAIGVQKNWSACDNPAGNAFYYVGDGSTSGYLDKLAYLLDSGIKVNLLYGDRDYICNWFGGEAISLAIPWKHQKEFAEAGYEDIRVNASYVGGQVRQYGPLSFTRVFQAGHTVPGYQPETAWRIFTRALGSQDVATGLKGIQDKDGKWYASTGPKDSRSVKNVLPPQPKVICYVGDVNGTCTNEQFASLLTGKAVVKNFFLVNENSTAEYPQLVGGGK
ncbi:uncharacterized protein MYCFIDRAFT_52091 [Pseudocercospora fijiensis CIRAD86]|uniref:Carboxypeptidase n=1 Tax=Pseudocercospora fijiensis (strain CIRAD86) TaxID=383855 RepID=M3AWB3_PSEFD|nr:uncharacterized protein MYCFIDRAFT_52091 [Pseudocercospora fijiensis CIRAD86]EME81428.1 hypothetical protein MYCFIDRAFT_52091 [Pseudocercospora fijiensis CIRAD86]